MDGTLKMHDQHLTQLRMEIKRKDVQIKSLQDAKDGLEESLAKHIQVRINIRLPP